MTKKQYAFIIKAKELIKEIRKQSIWAQDESGRLDNSYYTLSRIEGMCDDFLNDFENTAPNIEEC